MSDEDNDNKEMARAWRSRRTVGLRTHTTVRDRPPDSKPRICAQCEQLTRERDEARALLRRAAQSVYREGEEDYRDMRPDIALRNEMLAVAGGGDE